MVAAQLLVALRVYVAHVALPVYFGQTLADRVPELALLVSSLHYHLYIIHFLFTIHNFFEHQVLLNINNATFNFKFCSPRNIYNFINFNVYIFYYKSRISGVFEPGKAVSSVFALFYIAPARF